MTPHHLHDLAGWNLHALAAAWSLHTARQHLAQYARDEAAQIAAERLNAADGLRSPTWGTRHASGGHGDPVSTLVLAVDAPPRVNRWWQLAERTHDTLRWLAVSLDTAHADRDPLFCLIAGLRDLQPGTAVQVHRWLTEADERIRNATGAAPAREPLPGVACPHCGERQLVVQTAGPVDAWTVICATGRLCTGQGCPCGMPGAVEGVAHIWLRAAVIAGAVAGAAPSRP